MIIKINKYIKIILKYIQWIFAIIGFVFTLVFIAMQLGLLNVRGSIKDRNQFFINAYNSEQSFNKDCSLIINKYIRECSWQNTEEFDTVSAGLFKDKDIIDRVSKETDISSKLIKSVIIAEQLRFFTSEREVYKKWFEPLKILGSMSQFSLGVSGVKAKTASLIEQHLVDKKSDYYIEEKYASLLLDNNQLNSNDEIYKRLTDNQDHYYSYLYTAIFIKQIIKQWSNKGYDISKSPGLIGTIFNLGFEKSIPNNNPVIGGSVINIGGENYYYGELSELYYNYNKDK